MLLAIADLLILCAAAVACVVRPSRAAAWLLVVCSAVWLPLNNGHMEGPVLLTVSRDHGLTFADLAAYGGWAIAAWTLYRVRRPDRLGRRLLPVVAAGLVLLTGLGVSYFVKPAHDNAFHHRHWPSAYHSRFR